MDITFYKYQGAGNDFIVIDDRKSSFDRSNTSLVKHLCNRKFGIGADGLMLLRSSPEYDFEMVYYNADGFEGSMCGNGGRCIVAFAVDQEIIGKECCFIAVDGAHTASVLEHDQRQWISLKMIDVDHIQELGEASFCDTGSPHYVQEVSDLGNFQVIENGRRVRNSPRFKKEGTNVNYIQMWNDHAFSIRTYERGVEDETLACGTGVTAAAISIHARGLSDEKEFDVQALGGKLKVSFEVKGTQYSNVYLQGPAELVFKGVIDVKI